MKWVTATQVLTVVFFAAAFIWATLGLFNFIRYYKDEDVGLVSFALSAIAFGALCKMTFSTSSPSDRSGRTVLWSIDPNRIKLILPSIAYRLITSIPVVVWFSVGLASDIYW